MKARKCLNFIQKFKLVKAMQWDHITSVFFSKKKLKNCSINTIDK